MNVFVMKCLKNLVAVIRDTVMTRMHRVRNEERCVEELEYVERDLTSRVDQ